MNSLEADFHCVVGHAAHDVELIAGERQGNHVWFVSKNGDTLFKTTTSWFPHIGFIHRDTETREVIASTRKVIVYE